MRACPRRYRSAITLAAYSFLNGLGAASPGHFGKGDLVQKPRWGNWVDARIAAAGAYCTVMIADDQRMRNKGQFRRRPFSGFRYRAMNLDKLVLERKTTTHQRRSPDVRPFSLQGKNLLIEALRPLRKPVASVCSCADRYRPYSLRVQGDTLTLTPRRSGGRRVEEATHDGRQITAHCVPFLQLRRQGSRPPTSGCRCSHGDTRLVRRVEDTTRRSRSRLPSIRGWHVSIFSPSSGPLHRRTLLGCRPR